MRPTHSSPSTPTATGEAGEPCGSEVTTAFTARPAAYARPAASRTARLPAALEALLRLSAGLQVINRSWRDRQSPGRASCGPQRPPPTSSSGGGCLCFPLLLFAERSQAAQAEDLQLSISEDGLRSLIPQPAPRECWDSRGVYFGLLGRACF